MLPRAQFPDPLIVDRRRRGLAYWVATLKKPWVIGLLIASAALALIHWGLIVAAIVVILVATLYLAQARAKREWWVLLLQQLGMQPELIADIPGLTPLLRSGDERKVLNAATDGRRQLVHFRSTDITRDKNGEHRTNHDYTLVTYRDAAPPIRYLSAHEHTLRALKFLGDDQRGRTQRDIEEFKTESVDLHEQWELRSSTEDQVQARQLFEPTFILWFLRSGLQFEYEQGSLVIAVDRIIDHAEEYKMLLSRADQIHAQLSGIAAPVPARASVPPQ
jgi:hypothetical protein